MFMDPGDIHLLGFVIDNKLYFDITLSMGARSSCICCQKTTDVITYIMEKEGFEDINYLDDLGGAEVEDLAQQAFDLLGQIMINIGIRESTKKAVAPTSCMTFLGILFNTLEMTMTITPERCEEVRGILQAWLLREQASLRDMQQLLGKLNFLCSTVRAGRVFVSRIINLMKECGDRPVDLTEEFKKDLKWWLQFMNEFDGVTMVTDCRWAAPDTLISSDATNTTCGGWSDSEYWHAGFPADLLSNSSIHINELEALALIVSVKVWREKVRNHNVLMFCDNKVTVDIVNTGRATNEFAQGCLRELCYITAKLNAAIKVISGPGPTIGWLT